MKDDTVRKVLEAWRQAPVFLSTGAMFGHIDYAVVHREKNNQIVLLVRGWLFHPEQRVTRLIFPFFNQQEILVRGLPRSDVTAAFPWAPHAASSGFSVALRLPAGFSFEEELSLSFTVVLEDSSTISGRFGPVPYTLFPVPQWTSPDKAKLNFGRAPDFAARRLIFYTSPEQRQLPPGGESAADSAGTVWVYYGGVSSEPDTVCIETKDELRAFLAHQASSLEEVILLGGGMRELFMKCNDLMLCFAEEVKYSYG